jgi:type III secretion protein W
MSTFGDVEGQKVPHGQDITLKAMQEAGLETQAELTAERQDSQKAFIADQKDLVNPFASRLQTTQKSIKSSKSRIQKMLKGGDKPSRLLPIELMKDMAGHFQQRNPELRSNVLILLREYIKPDDTAEDILRKVLEFYPDVSLADEALEYLLATTEGNLAVKVQEARDMLNKDRGREIIAGRNIGAQAREASEKGLGTPTNLRDLYRDVTGNPRDSGTMFEELSEKYAFKELKKVVDFLLHSLGADMKSQGPSIPRGMLHRLFTETRSLQAILGVYRFFRGRMHLMESLFEKEQIELPPQLNFELMAKAFMALAADRYPTAAKVKDTAVRLGIEKWIQAKIIALSQLRDAVREVAMNQIYRSVQHRDELYMTIIEALEDLEDELEELEEQMEREAAGGGYEEDEDDDEDQEE